MQAGLFIRGLVHIGLPTYGASWLLASSSSILAHTSMRPPAQYIILFVALLCFSTPPPAPPVAETNWGAAIGPPPSPLQSASGSVDCGNERCVEAKQEQQMKAKLLRGQ